MTGWKLRLLMAIGCGIGIIGLAGAAFALGDETPEEQNSPHTFADCSPVVMPNSGNLVIRCGDPPRTRQAQKVFQAYQIQTPEQYADYQLLAIELSKEGASSLRLYQFMENLCDQIVCYKIAPDKVRAMIANELAARNEGDRSYYTRMSTITGGVSATISAFSLCISGLAYRRGRIPPTSSNSNAPSTGDGMPSNVVSQKS